MELALEAGPRLPASALGATMRPVAANDPSDGELIRRTGEGDSDAFEVLYRRYARPNSRSQDRPQGQLPFGPRYFAGANRQRSSAPTFPVTAL